MRQSLVAISFIIISCCDGPASNATGTMTLDAVAMTPKSRRSLGQVHGRASHLSGAARDRQAWKKKGKLVRSLFKRAGVAFPPRALLFRVYKKERILEAWARDVTSARYKRVARYGICAASGVAGPKKRSGDLQVPEGFYRINYFKKRSSYHLAMRIGYPNQRDRQLGFTGSAIMIHGGCASIGCLAMGDERIQELWVMARAAKRGVHVHLYPQRDLGAALRSAALDPSTRRLWRSLKQGHDYFEAHQRLPAVRMRGGRYRVGS